MNHSPPEDGADSFDAILELAREHQPDREPRPGFDTRLQARIRELRAVGDAGAVLPLFTRWLWRASWGLSPVVVALTVLVALMYGFDLPDGAGSLIGHFADWLPGGDF